MRTDEFLCPGIWTKRSDHHEGDGSYWTNIFRCPISPRGK